jgi:cold shock CspA family protein
MKGIVKTYLPEKQYGFLKGDDGKDYFFHANEFLNKAHINNICEDTVVEFEQFATPKGYTAKRCSLIDASDILTYAVPDEFIASRSGGVRGWEVVERGNWIVHGTSNDSPDSAKRDCISNAAQIGANGFIDLDYYKTTGSERGTGRGTHYYTIHNFRGRPVVYAKRNSRGEYTLDELSRVNKRASKLKKELVAKNKRRRNIIWSGLFVLSVFALMIEPMAVIVLLVIGILSSWFVSDYDWWLNKS